MKRNTLGFPGDLPQTEKLFLHVYSGLFVCLFVFLYYPGIPPPQMSQMINLDSLFFVIYFRL